MQRQTAAALPPVLLGEELGDFALPLDLGFSGCFIPLYFREMKIDISAAGLRCVGLRLDVSEILPAVAARSEHESLLSNH